MTGALFQFKDVCHQSIVHDAADVVIVGSGAAGATCARVLSERGLDVVILEEGPSIPIESLRADAYSSFRSQWRSLGFQAARGRAFLPILQGSAVGGTTVVNGAIIHRLPPKILAHWDSDFGLGGSIQYKELDRIFNQLDEELCVAEVAEHALGGNNSLMRKGVQGIGAQGNVIRRNVRGDCTAARCLQGCPEGRRQSMNISYVPRAMRHGARVYANCRAGIIAAESGRARGVHGQFFDHESKRRGPKIYVMAKRAVILAASAVQTPLLLQKNGIGRRSKLAGRRFQAHPGSSVIGVFDSRPNLWHGATQGYESTHFWDERMKFEAVGVPPEVLAARLPGFGPRLLQAMHEGMHLAQWGVQIRAKTLGKIQSNLFETPSIFYDLCDEDVQCFKIGIQRLVGMMFAAGARYVLPGFHGLPERLHSAREADAIHNLPNDPRALHCIAAHLFGTAIMGPDPRSSVVDLHRQAHDLPGLYIADSSVFPTNIGVNPQHSIAAIAWLTAEHIAERTPA